MNWNEHPNYRHLAETARASHKAGRSVSNITQNDIDLARLYSYAFRTQTIGAFHATRDVLLNQPASPSVSDHIRRATETLQDLANIAIDSVPIDARVVVSTFHRYDTWSRRVLRDLERIVESSSDSTLANIRDRFFRTMDSIVSCNGVCLTSDAQAVEQANFVVPNLGITIVPLAYGDHHSWNMARLSSQHPDVPRHLHRQGVEIHLGYAPIKGYMVLGDCCAKVDEGYALAIPPDTPHGYINATEAVHHVPFIFGSRKLGGWGVFLDVEATPCQLSDLKETARAHPKMNAAIWLEREMESVKKSTAAHRRIIVPAHRTYATGVGGIEIAATRVTQKGFSFPTDSYRIVSVVRGSGKLRLANLESEIHPHDHFGIPAEMAAHLQQVGEDPLVLLDAMLRDAR